MTGYDFGFSLSENSVNEITGLIEQYSEDVVTIMNGFQDDIVEKVSTVYYDKLVKAVDGIIELYNKSVQVDLKKSILEHWQNTCESMFSFAEKMGMGEESENVAAEIEESLYSIFDTEIENRLKYVNFSGRTGASITDFDSIVEMFGSVIEKIQELTDCINAEAKRLSEDNEFYRFIVPVIDTYGRGICNYFGDAIKNLEELKENYVSKMTEKRDAVQDNKQEVDFSSLLDFSDLVHAGMGRNFQSFANGKKDKIPAIDLITWNDNNFDRGSVDKINKIIEFSDSVKDNEIKSRKHIQNIGEKLMSDFASKRSDRKRIEDVIEYANADNLERDLRNFDRNGCTISKEISNIYAYKKNRLETEYNKSISFIKKEYDEKLENLEKDLKEELEKEKKLLEKRYIKRMISSLVGIDLYKKSLDQVNNSFKNRRLELKNQYDEEKSKIKDNHSKKLNELKNEELENEECVELYEQRYTLADKIKNEEVNIKKNIYSKLLVILNNCDSPCLKFVKIYQDVYLAMKPSVLGFSNGALGHRITINEKNKSWIDANLKTQEKESVSIDGILNMKTPIHEYLHYLSNDKNGTSGVINMEQINQIKEKKERQVIRDAMVGFNEGITEMFAQDYLIDEMDHKFDFENVNTILNNNRLIIRQKSYSPQVQIVRTICKTIGSSEPVKEAYINHNFSIIEKEITSALGKKGKTIDWDQIKEDMAKIQNLYTGKNPILSREEANSLVDKIIKKLEGKYESEEFYY